MKAKAIILTLSALLLVSTSALADVPSEVTYNGRLLYNGNPVTSGTSIVFRLFQTSSGGSAVWTETHTVTPDSNGIYTQILGSTSAIPDDYDSLWIELVVAGNTLTPRKKITSSPFVLRAGELPDLYVSGKIGIGTTSPGLSLDVYINNNWGFQVSDGTERVRISDSAIGQTDDGSTYSYLFVKSGSSYFNAGNVGIGTTNPGSKLHVVSDAPLRLTRDVSGTLYGIDTNIDSARFIFNGVGPSPASNILTMRHDTGYVGINQNTPPGRFTVRGSGGDANGFIRVESTAGYHRAIYLGGASDLYFNNGINAPHITDAGTWTDGSDLAYKKDIRGMTKYGLDTVMSLNPVEYRMKESDSEQIGFIAQHVKEVIPEVVDGEEGHLGLAYGHLTAILVKAVQEQQKQIEKLQAALEDKM